MFPDLQNPVGYEGGKPVFAYFRPFVSNNSDYDVPRSECSVYANRTDTLRALDTVFDSFPGVRPRQEAYNRAEQLHSDHG